MTDFDSISYSLGLLTNTHTATYFSSDLEKFIREDDFKRIFSMNAFDEENDKKLIFVLRVLIY